MFEFLTSAYTLLLKNIWQFVLFYFIAGIAYTFVKWVFSLLKLRQKVNAISDKDLRLTPTTPMQILREREANKVFGVSSYPPKASELTSLFLYWAVFWPIDLVFSLLGDILVQGWKWVIRTLANIYQMFVHLILPN